MSQKDLYLREARYQIDKGGCAISAFIVFCLVSLGAYFVWDKIQSPIVAWIAYIAIMAFIELIVFVCYYNAATAVVKDIQPSSGRIRRRK